MSVSIMIRFCAVATCSLLVVGPLASCAKKPPTKPELPASTSQQPAKTPKDRPKKSPAPLTAAQQQRLETIEKADGKAWCDLAKTADPQRDRAIVIHVLRLAFERGRAEAHRSCSFRLLKKMGANEALHDVARSHDDVESWLAILAWAGRNLRAKHFRTYELGLQHDDTRVQRSAAAAIGKHTASPGALAVLAKALAAADPNIRVVAVDSAGNMDHPEALQLVRQRERVENDVTVQRAIRRLLGKKP